MIAQVLCSSPLSADRALLFKQLKLHSISHFSVKNPDGDIHSDSFVFEDYTCLVIFHDDSCVVLLPCDTCISFESFESFLNFLFD